MKDSTKNVIKSVFFGIIVYFVEFVLIFGLVKLICKIVDMVRCRRYDKTHKSAENIEDAELDPKPYVETPKTTWDAVKPYTFISDDNINVSFIKSWEDGTMKDVIDNILHYYITKKALVSIVYKGKALDVWITPGTKTLYLDCDNEVKLSVDDDFMNMKVKKTTENIHLAYIED